MLDGHIAQPYGMLKGEDGSTKRNDFSDSPTHYFIMVPLLPPFRRMQLIAMGIFFL